MSGPTRTCLMIGAGVAATVFVFNALPERPGLWKHRLKHAIGQNHGFMDRYRGTDHRLHGGRFCAICLEWKPDERQQPLPAPDFTPDPFLLQSSEPHRVYANRWGWKSYADYTRWRQAHYTPTYTNAQVSSDRATWAASEEIKLNPS